MIPILYHYGVWSVPQTPKYIANRPMQHCAPFLQQIFTTIRRQIWQINLTWGSLARTLNVSVTFIASPFMWILDFALFMVVILTWKWTSTYWNHLAVDYYKHNCTLMIWIFLQTFFWQSIKICGAWDQYHIKLHGPCTT